MDQQLTRSVSRSYSRRSESRLRSIPLSQGSPPSNSSYLIGISILFIVVLLWTGGSLLTEALFIGGFEKPFLLTYLNTSSFTLYFVPYTIKQWKGVAEGAIVINPTEPHQGHYNTLPVLETLETDDSMLSLESDPILLPMTIRQTAQLANTFGIFRFASYWALAMSLKYTSVASSTIFVSMSGFITLLLGCMLGIETISIPKFGAVVASFTGIVIVSLADSTSPSTLSFHAGTQPLLGDFFGFLSALFYAMYVIVLKVSIKDQSRVDMDLLFGLVGLFDTLCYWPVGIGLHLMRVEVFGLPVSRTEWTNVVLMMLITVSSEYLNVLAMLRTTPLVATIGISLTIPIAILGDFCFFGNAVQLQVLAGALLVAGSFVVIGLEGST